jgi:hypothetical protein
VIAVDWPCSQVCEGPVKRRPTARVPHEESDRSLGFDRGADTAR